MRRLRIALLVVVLVILISAGIWWFHSMASPAMPGISASGFIEATQVSIAPEIGGRIVSIALDEGDQATSGATLVKLDDSLLKAQQAQAGAAVAQAQAAVEQAQALVDQAQAGVDQATMARNQVTATRDGAQKAMEDALNVQQYPYDVDAQLVAAQGQVTVAQAALDIATTNFTKLTYPYTFSTLAFDVPTAVGYVQDAQGQINTIQKTLQTGLTTDQYNQISNQIQLALDNLNKGINLLALGKGPDIFQGGLLNVKDFWTVRAAQLQMDQAQAALDTANKTLKIMADKKNNPQQINAAVDSARAAYNTAIAAAQVADSGITTAQKQVGTAQKQVAVAQKQVEQAQAALQVLNVQVGKMTIASPISGTVASRNAEPGEVAGAGMPVLIINDLSSVTLTAYVPESQIGQVKPGDKAQVSIDSYPGEIFAGSVSFISPQALFTPGNVQLKNEREKTVFAVKIKLPNPERKLKPGMPADVQIVVGQ